MRKYEITYLSVGEENASASLIAPVLATKEAKIVSVHPWGGRRRLTYPIKKQDQAFFTTVVFEAEPVAVQPIDAALQLNNDVLRFLIVHYEPGTFDRPATYNSENSREVETKPSPRVTEVKGEAPAEVAAESVATDTPAEAPVKPAPKKRATKKATKADDKVLDEKIEELLKEDITS